MKYIWQHDPWPQLTWKSEPLLPLISKTRLEQGARLTNMKGLGFKLSREARADILTEEALNTSAIEGERLNRESVRSSVAKHLGPPTVELPTTTRAVDGLVEVLLEATQQYDKPLTSSRLKRWHVALFPTGDVTEWLVWFLQCHRRAVERARRLLATVLAKTGFWQHHGETALNARQRKVVNKLLDAGPGGFQGGLTTRKYVSMAHVSRATAFREIAELVQKGVLRHNAAKGRSASYDLRWAVRGVRRP